MLARRRKYLLHLQSNPKRYGTPLHKEYRAAARHRHRTEPHQRVHRAAEQRQKYYRKDNQLLPVARERPCGEAGAGACRRAAAC